MKLNQDKNLLEVEGFDNNSKQFSIKQSAKAFEVLSSNIYSNKIKAVVREYSTNALDAHVVSNKQDIPFQVHLPNQYEPWFSVRDFGPGLSDENVMTLYTTYFSSTKEDTNDQTGCLGLGSKSGFAYTDQFTVTSYFEGFKRTYSAHINEDGAPCITMLTEEICGDPSGLEINLPVKSNDFSSFAREAGIIYSRFPVLPVITGNTQVNLAKINYTLHGDGYKLRKLEGGDQGGAVAVQGAVYYPIEYDSLNIADHNSDVKQFLRNCPIDITFPIGQLNITASRERLNYDRNTIKNIITRVGEILEDLPKHFENYLEDADTLWQAKKLFSEFRKHENHIPSVVKKMINAGLKWKNEVIKDIIFRPDLRDEIPQIDPTTLKPVVSHLDNNKKPVYLMQKVPYGDMLLFTRDSLNSARYAPFNGHSMDVSPQDQIEVVVVIGNKPRSLNNIIRHNYGQHDTIRRVLVMIIYDASRVVDALETVGNVDYVNFTDLAEPPKTTAIVSDGTPRKVFPKLEKILGVSGWALNTSGEQTVIDTSDPKVIHKFVMTYGNDPVEGDFKNITEGRQSLHRTLESAAQMKILDFTNDTIYRVRSSDKNVVLDKPNFVNFFDVLKQEIASYSTGKTKFTRPNLEAIVFFEELVTNRDLSYLKYLYEFINRDTYSQKSLNLKKNKDIRNAEKLFEKKWSELPKNVKVFQGDMKGNSHYGVSLWVDNLRQICTSLKLVNPIFLENKAAIVNGLKMLQSKISLQYPTFKEMVDQNMRDISIFNYLELCEDSPKIAQNIQPK